jgi:hypothetical protein
MSNTSSQALSVRERPATSDRRLYLAAGFGGVLAAASWAIQPLLVMQAGDDLPTLDYLLTHPWHGAIGCGRPLPMQVLQWSTWP